ncbi:MAG: hypothetical protein ABSD97_02555 [Acidimicrobiales bacterium]
MGALAQTERMTVASLAGPEKRPRPATARCRRPSTRQQPSWNVLAQEIVSFTPRRATRVLAQPPSELGRRRLGRPVRTSPPGSSQVRRVTTLAQSSSSRSSAPQGGDRTAIVGSVGTAGYRRAASRPRGLRRLLPGAATLAVLASVWFGTGALASLHRPSLSIPAAAVKVPGGYLYVARPGDTLWSIASELQPGGDPRPLVAELETQLHGAELVAGDELKLP